MSAKLSFEYGQKYPYDATDKGSFPKGDWAIAAARGIINDLSDRRGIKRGFEEVDLQTRREIVKTMAAIIRLSKP